MTPRCYEIRQFASHERCDLAGYHHFFEAYDQEGKCRAAATEPSQRGDCWSKRFFIRSEQVWSPSGDAHDAIQRFRQWESTGKPRGWLLDPNFKETPDPISILEALYKWWTETPAFQDGEDDMPAEIFDGMRDAIAKARGQR